MSARATRLTLALLLSLALPQPAPAASSTPPLSGAGGQTVAAAPELYDRATRHLREGHWYEDAIAQLSEAIRQDPANASYRLALGCANADRAASLAYAAMYVKMLADAHAQYAQQVKDWEAAQKNPGDWQYGAPCPTPPPVLYFTTKDDLKRFRLTPAQTVARVAELGTAAVATWKEARASETTPAGRAEADYTQGWGLDLLRAAWDQVEGSKSLSLSPSPETKAFDATMREADTVALKAMQEATKLAPDNAVYWQSLGDILGGNALGVAPDSSVGSSRQAADAYTRSLALQPRDSALWYRLYERQAGDAPDRARAALQRAAQGDPGNSFYDYSLAALLFKKTTYGLILGSGADQLEQQLNTPRDAASQSRALQAVAAVERGNAAPDYRKPVYTPPVPPMMAVAAGYAAWHNMLFPELPRLRELARCCNGFAQQAARRNNVADAVRASRASITLGFKMAGEWPVKEDPATGKTVINTLVGIAVAAIGYRTLQTLYEQSGDTAMAQQTAAESEALKQRKKAYAQAVTASLNSAMYESY